MKIDKSLAEVLEWRESLRKTTESMSEEEETEYLHQTTLKLLHSYGLKRVPIDESSGRLVKA
jgi:hypothetical protein